MLSFAQDLPYAPQAVKAESELPAQGVEACAAQGQLLCGFVDFDSLACLPGT